MNPISVRRSTGRIRDVGRVTWLWECLLCGRRAYHRSDRYSDRYRAQLGKEPDVHASQRALEGGLRHLHRKHTPCTCCATGEHHGRFTSSNGDSRITNQEVNS